jgi:hypothetical protein
MNRISEERRLLSIPEVFAVICCMLLPVALIGTMVGFRLGVGTHYNDEDMARLALVEEFHCCSCGDSFLAEVGTYCPECGSRASGAGTSGALPGSDLFHTT